MYFTCYEPDRERLSRPITTDWTIWPIRAPAVHLHTLFSRVVLRIIMADH